MRRGRNLPESALESLDPEIKFRSKSHLIAKNLDKFPAAEIGLPGDDIDAGAMRHAREAAKRVGNGRMMAETLWRPFEERSQQDVEFVLRRRRRDEALVQPLGVGTPHIVERDVAISKGARRRAEERPRATGAKLHPHHLPLKRIDGDGARLRPADSDSPHAMRRGEAIAVIPAEAILREIDHQSRARRGKDRVPRVIERLAFPIPEQLDKAIERRRCGSHHMAHAPSCA